MSMLNSLTTVVVDAPPSSCCDTAWVWSDCNVLQQAINNASDYTTIELKPGTYCNNGYYIQSKSDPSEYQNGTLASIQDKKHLTIKGLWENGERPVLKFDGWYGIKITTSENIIIHNLEVQGVNLRIDGVEATANRDRMTGLDDGGCGGYDGTATEDECNAVENCTWSSTLGYCYGDLFSYYSGIGIAVEDSDTVHIRLCEVHHCPGSGIRADRSDNISIYNNLVYGNTWWTTAAPSALTFAEATGTGENNLVGNVVYGNRNFMPYFKTYIPTGGAEVNSVYGAWNQDYIIDGPGVSLTRNQDYEGTFNLNNNIAYDNGINGLVLHKATNANATLNAKNNLIFANGTTTKD